MRGEWKNDVGWGWGGWVVHAHLEGKDAAEEDDDDRVPRGKDAQRLDLVVLRVHVRHRVGHRAARRDAHGHVHRQREDVCRCGSFRTSKNARKMASASDGGQGREVAEANSGVGQEMKTKRTE